MALDPNRVDLYSGPLMATVPYAQRNQVPAPVAPMAPAAPAINPNIRRQMDPSGVATDEELQALLVRFPIRSDGVATFQVQPDKSVATGYYSTALGRFSVGDMLPTIGVALGTEQRTPEMNTRATNYSQLVNPYGNAYMQRLQEQLAGRSEANLQRMNALMSQRGMGGTGLASARALQAQSDVGQQLLGAQQEATQLGAQFDLSRLAGMTGQQQFARQQSEAERQAAAGRSLARRADVRAERGQVAELLAPAAKAAALGVSRPAASTTGGGVARPAPQQTIGFTNSAGQYSQMTPQAYQRQQEQAFKKLFNPLRGTSLEGM